MKKHSEIRNIKHYLNLTHTIQSHVQKSLVSSLADKLTQMAECHHTYRTTSISRRVCPLFQTIHWIYFVKSKHEVIFSTSVTSPGISTTVLPLLVTLFSFNLDSSWFVLRGHLWCFIGLKCYSWLSHFCFILSSIFCVICLYLIFVAAYLSQTFVVK